MPSLRERGVVFNLFFLKPADIMEMVWYSCILCFFLKNFTRVSLHTLSWVQQSVLTFTTTPPTTLASRHPKCPGGIFWNAAQAVNPTTLFDKGCRTTNQSANPSVNTLYNDMLWCWFMNYSMITFVSSLSVHSTATRVVACICSNAPWSVWSADPLTIEMGMAMCVTDVHLSHCVFVCLRQQKRDRQTEGKAIAT